MQVENKHEVKRYLSPEIKREVRQRCYFGCVVCGTAIIQYHHFDPEFANALKHDPKGITLLCPTCHEKVNKKVFNKDFIKKNDSNPFCKQSGTLKDIFYIGTDLITFRFGDSYIKWINILEYDDTPLIGFSPPEMTNAPFRLNAKLYDKNEKEMLTIIDNEWITGTNHFDIETNSNELIIREKLGDIKLRLSHTANKEISIQSIDMNYKGFIIKASKNEFEVKAPQGAKMIFHTTKVFTSIKMYSDGKIIL